MSLRSALGLVLTWHDAARFADRSSEELLARYVATRDEAAFRELLRRHAPHVWAVCRRELKSPDLADDAFQTTFVALVRKAHQVRQPGSLAGWLDRTARRAAGAIRRTAARRAEVEAAMPPAGPAPEKDAADRAEAVRAAVAELPDRYRLPVTYRYLTGLSAADVARVLGDPEETIRTRLKRGVELLKQKLGGKGLGIGVGTAGGTVSVETALTAAAESVPQTVLAATIEAVRALPVKRGLLAAITGVVTYKRAVVGMTVLAFGMAGALVGIPGPKYRLNRVSSNDNHVKDPSMRASPLLALAAGLALAPKAPAQNILRMADTSTLIPNGTGNYTSFVSQLGASSPSIAFAASGNSGQSGIYTYSVTTGQLTTFADTTTSIPNGTGTFTTIPEVYLRGTNIFFRAGGTNQSGVYSGSVVGGPLTRIADRNTNIPNGTGSFTGFDISITSSISESSVAFLAYGSNGQQGIYTSPVGGGSLSVVADKSTLIPGGSGSFTGLFKTSMFGSTIVFAGEGIGVNGIYAGTTGGGPLTRVVDSSTTIPNGSGTFAYLDSPSISGSNVAFVGGTFGIGTDFQRGVYVGSVNGGPFVRVVDKTSTVPGTTFTFTSFSRSYLSGSRVAYVGNYDGVSKSGLYIGAIDGSSIEKIVSSDDVLDGRIVAGVGGGMLNGSLLAFQIRFTDGSSGVYYTVLPLPESRYGLAAVAAAVGLLGLGRWMLGGF